MTHEQIQNELINFIKEDIKAKLINDLAIKPYTMIKKVEVYLNKLNQEYNLNYDTNITKLVVDEINNAKLDPYVVSNKVNAITNTNLYNYSQIEYDLINSSDDIGYNDKVVYYSDGWQEYSIRFKYQLDDNNILVYSVDKA